MKLTYIHFVEMIICKKTNSISRLLIKIFPYLYLEYIKLCFHAFWCFVLLISQSCNRGSMFIKTAATKFGISQFHLQKALKVVSCFNSCNYLTYLCNLINAHTHTHAYTHRQTDTHTSVKLSGRAENLCSTLRNTDKHWITNTRSDLLPGRVFHENTLLSVCVCVCVCVCVWKNV